MNRLNLLSMLVLGMLLVPGFAQAGQLRVEDGWIAAAPPGAKMLACYMTVINATDRDVTLLGARVDGVKMTELHRTVMNGEMGRMEKQASLLIPAGEAVTLEPGGYHWMLMHPQRTFGVGDRVSVDLQFSEGVVHTSVEVRKRQ